MNFSRSLIRSTKVVRHTSSSTKLRMSFLLSLFQPNQKTNSTKIKRESQRPITIFSNTVLSLHSNLEEMKKIEIRVKTAKEVLTTMKAGSEMSKYCYRFKINKTRPLEQIHPLNINRLTIKITCRHPEMNCVEKYSSHGLEFCVRVGQKSNRSLKINGKVKIHRILLSQTKRSILIIRGLIII